MSFFAMEQGSKTISFEAPTLDEIVKMVGPRAESQGKTFVIFGQVGVVEPVKTFSFRTLEELRAESAAATAIAAANAVASAETDAVKDPATAE